MIALTAAATGVALAGSPLEATAWHLVAQRDQTKVAGIGTWDWRQGEAMKRVTVTFSNPLAQEIMVGNLTDIANDEGYSTDFTFMLTKNKCSGVVKSGKLTITWEIAGKLTTPDVKKKTASHQVLAAGTQVQ